MGENVCIPYKETKGAVKNTTDRRIDVYIWDMDETLILLKSLLNRTYADNFNGLKNVQKGVEIGKMWEKHILDLCDNYFFYEQVCVHFSHKFFFALCLVIFFFFLISDANPCDLFYVWKVNLLRWVLSTQIENYNKPFLDALIQYDDARDLSGYDFDQDGFGPPYDDDNKRKLSYRHRDIAQKYEKVLIRLYFLPYNWCSSFYLR